VTVYSSCLTCGKPCPRSRSYCGLHAPVPRSRALRGGGATIRAFRKAAFQLAGNRCMAVEGGVRCDERRPERLEAHHIVPVSQGGANDASNAVLLCKRHHLLVEAQRLREPA
jgi:5-methylcytosine-specific restriction endonuclease McrA